MCIQQYNKQYLYRAVCMYVCMCVGSGAPERSPPWYVLSWCVHSTQQKLLCTFFCARLPPAQRNPEEEEEEEEEPAIHTIQLDRPPPL